MSNWTPCTRATTEEDYDAFCLAYMFTYRDFEMGTLGLAWTGDLKNAGGVCEKNGVSSASALEANNNENRCGVPVSLPMPGILMYAFGLGKPTASQTLARPHWRRMAKL